MDTKQCRICGEEQPLSEFHRATGTRDGHRGECKTCFRLLARERYVAKRKERIAAVPRWRDENPEHYRAYQAEYRQRPDRKRAMRDLYYRRTYGISAEAFDAMLAEQNGRCAICRARPERAASMHVDHDHERGHIRGLVCLSCNQGLGQFRDDPTLLLRAIVYLRQRSSSVALSAGLGISD